MFNRNYILKFFSIEFSHLRINWNLRWFRHHWIQRRYFHIFIHTGCAKNWPNKHENSVTNSISSFIWSGIVIPDFKSHNIIISARVYFMKTVNGCKTVSLTSLHDEQWRRTSLLCLYTAILYNRMHEKHKQTKCEQISRRNS